MRNNCQDYAVITQKSMCLLRCEKLRSVFASVSTVSKIFSEFHNNYPNSYVAIYINDE